MLTDTKSFLKGCPQVQSSCIKVDSAELPKTDTVADSLMQSSSSLYPTGKTDPSVSTAQEADTTAHKAFAMGYILSLIQRSEGTA